MKMGVREFRSRITEVLHGDAPVIVTSNGRAIAEVVPIAARPASADLNEWHRRRITFRDQWRKSVPDWAERLERFGLDEEGYPFEDPPFR